MTALLEFLLSALVGAALAAQPVVLDGDTLDLHGTRWRLHATDAPEVAQTCPDGWPAGKVAAAYLVSLTQGRTLTCQPLGRDRYGRTIGRCWADGRDIEADMVAAGMAWAKYGPDYRHLEQRAKGLRLGVHLHGCQPAWLWRKEHR